MSESPAPVQLTPPDTKDPVIRDFVAVGAGPHSLAVVSRLLETKSRFYTDHDLTTKRKYYQEVDEKKKPLDVAVVDPAGRWLARWHSQFEQMKIKFLRSPVTAHPGKFHLRDLRCCEANLFLRENFPCGLLWFVLRFSSNIISDPFEDTALLSFASGQKREAELLPIDNLFFRTAGETRTSKSNVTYVVLVFSNFVFGQQQHCDKRQRGLSRYSFSIGSSCRLLLY